MTKKELATATAELLASKNGSSNVNHIEEVIDSVITVSKAAVMKGHTIHIRGFGSLGLKQRKAKIAQNIKAGIQVPVPACKVPYFKPSKEFKKLLN